MCDFQINGVLVTKLRVVDLKEELEARGLSKSGKKDELIARLVSYLEVSSQLQHVQIQQYELLKKRMRTIESRVSNMTFLHSS